MLLFISNMTNFLNYMINDYYNMFQTMINIDLLNLHAHLLLQFGLLVFLLSLIALASPAYFGLYGSFILTMMPLFFTWIYSFSTFIEMYNNKTIIFMNGFKWFYLPGVFQMNFDIFMDKLSMTYVLLILSMGLCVLMYTFSYFSYEPHVESLFLFINLFMMSMCILVLGGNLFVLFLGWELIGLTSFFLINFWSTKMSTLKAAFKAFIFNKVSDLGMLMFMMLNILMVGESNILVLNSIYINFIDYSVNLLNVNISFTELLSFFLMLSAFIKSAQFGFHVWLPDSMEAPVPASALIHSATLVSAGVFLLISFSFLMELTTLMLYWIMLTSAMTAALGGVGACFQSDIKRMLAYSTISHCGFLVFLSCFFHLEIVLLYLCVHGFFKALVFMCVGNVMRFARNYQDFRYMGGFAKYLPFEAIMMLIGLINLGGLPFSFGFFMKHYTLMSFFDLNNMLIKMNLFIGMFSSLMYSYSLYYYIFFDSKKAKKAIYISSSSNNLKSKFYSNTTLASNMAMIFLFLISYMMMMYMYFSFFMSTTTSSFSLSSSNNKTVYIIQNSLETLNNISTYINCFVLCIGVILLTMKFRYQYKYIIVLQKSTFIILFVFFLFMMMQLIMRL